MACAAAAPERGRSHTRRQAAVCDAPRPTMRPAPHAAAAARAAGGLLQPGPREPPHHPHRRERIPHRPAQQPLRPLRPPVPGLLRDRPPVPPGQVTGHGTDVLARLPPRLHPGEAQPQQPQQLTTLPCRQGGPYPGSRSRLRFCCRHTRIIDGRLRPVEPAASPCFAAGHDPNGDCRTRLTPECLLFRPGLSCRAHTYRTGCAQCRNELRGHCAPLVAAVGSPACEDHLRWSASAAKA